MFGHVGARAAPCQYVKKSISKHFPDYSATATSIQRPKVWFCRYDEEEKDDNHSRGGVVDGLGDLGHTDERAIHSGTVVVRRRIADRSVK